LLMWDVTPQEFIRVYKEKSDRVSREFNKSSVK